MPTCVTFGRLCSEVHHFRVFVFSSVLCDVKMRTFSVKMKACAGFGCI